MKLKKLKNAGLTLPELLVATFILTLIFSGMLLSYVKCMELNELSRNSTIAMTALQNKIEEINNRDFSDIVAAYNNQTWEIEDSGGNELLDGTIFTYVIEDPANPDLLSIRLSACWAQKNGRVIGEDADNQGDLDPGEDLNGNNRIDSPIELATNIYNS